MAINRFFFCSNYISRSTKFQSVAVMFYFCLIFSLTINLFCILSQIFMFSCLERKIWVEKGVRNVHELNKRKKVSPTSKLRKSNDHFREWPEDKWAAVYIIDTNTVLLLQESSWIVHQLAEPPKYMNWPTIKFANKWKSHILFELEQLVHPLSMFNRQLVFHCFCILPV